MQLFGWKTLVSVLVAACGGSSSDPADMTGAVDARPSPGMDATLAPGWERLPDVRGGAVQEIGVAELFGRIYVVGGFNTGLGIVADVQVYDIAAGSWSSARPVPMALHHANLAAAGGKLYLLGALADLRFTETGASWEYDPATDTWRSVASMSPEQARGAAAVGVIDDVIYLAGGYRQGAAVANVSAYDPATDTWDHSLASLPEARDHLAGGAVGGMLYAVSGRNRDISAITGRVDAYDPVADVWTERAPILTPRGGMAAGVVSGNLLVVGGEGASDVSSGVFDEVESYDPTTDTWSSLGSMPTPRHGMAAAGYQGTLYVPGGATTQGVGAVATFEAYTP